MIGQDLTIVDLDTVPNFTTENNNSDCQNLIILSNNIGIEVKSFQQQMK